MIEVSDQTAEALASTDVTTETFATAYYQTKSADLTIAQDGDITWDGDGEVQATSNLYVIGHGNSLVPRGDRGALLAPYGQEVSLVRRVFFRGRQTSDIPLGVYRIRANDGGRESFRGDRVLDWEIGLQLADRFRQIQKAKLVPVDASPPSGATVYSELQRLANIPILIDPAVPDVSVPRSHVYEDRLESVHWLAELAGAKPRLTRQGALTLRPADRWATETTPDFDITGELGENGGQTDEWFNYVWTHNDKGEFSAFAAITDDADPLSINRAGMATYEHSSPAYVSKAASQAGANTILERLTRRRAATVTAKVGAQGLPLELSDFGWIRDPDQQRAVLGEISKITIPHDPAELITLELIVAEEV